MAKTCYRGELYYADLGKGVGSEQEGSRPVVILQNDMGNRYSPTTIAAPISCKIDSKAKLPTHYILGPVAGLVRPSVVLLEQIRVIDKHRLERKLGSLSDRHIAGIEKVLKVSMGLLDSTGSILYPITHIQEGMELLMQQRAGDQDMDGNYPENTIHDRVFKKLKAFAELSRN